LKKVKKLLERGADVNARDSEYGATPLHHAAVYGHLEVARLLIEKGADVNAVDGSLTTPLHWAAVGGHLEVARLLLEKGADVNTGDREDCTPLHWAAFKGHLDVARLLIESGADVNAKNNTGWTPLHFAASKGYLDIARLLIEKGADVNAGDACGQWFEENDVLYEDFCERPLLCCGTPLHWAAFNGHLEVARLLIESGADINDGNRHSERPLHWAAFKGHLDVARLLIESGADVNASDFEGLKPLHFAAMEGHVEVVRLLIESGADVNAWGGEDCDTPLHFAAMEGHVEVVRLLIESGADVNARDCERLELMKFLLKKNDIGWTPLHWAAFKGHLDVARLLIESGADVNARDSGGRTPLDLAREKGHREVVELLESARQGLPARPQKLIVSVEAPRLDVGEWGALRVRLGDKARVSLEGDVDWLDPGEVDGIAEIPVKPKKAGKVPVTLVVKGKGREERRQVWLKVVVKKSRWDEELARVEGYLARLEELHREGKVSEEAYRRLRKEYESWKRRLEMEIINSEDTQP